MSMASKRLTLVLLGLSVAIGALWVIVYLKAPAAERRLSLVSALRKAGEQDQKPTSQIVAYINGSPITREDIRRQKVMMDSMPGVSPASKAQALQVIVRNLVLYEEAKRRGLAMSVEEARAVVAEQRRMYENGTLPDRDRLKQLIAALAVDERTYWEEIAPQQYAMLMSIVRWRQDMAKSVDIAYVQVGEPTPDDMSRQGSTIDRIIQGLVSKARLEVVDKQFIGE